MCCARLRRIGPEQEVAARTIYVEDEGRLETWVRLEVDGQPVMAFPRSDFLDALHHQIHAGPGGLAGVDA